MEYRVEELSHASGVPVDTIRFYQSRGLLPSPTRRGRVAYYADRHREQLDRIRSLRDQGFKLSQIRTVLEGAREGSPSGLLAALVQERVGERTMSRKELAAEAGIPAALVRAVEAAGLVEPLVIDGEERFGEGDLAMARMGLALLESGFPLQELLRLAVGHAQHVQEICDASIDLFDQHVRGGDNDDVLVTEAFRTLLPQVTRLVALHFQRTLVNRALNRLEGKRESQALAAARAATESARLEVDVAWR